MSERNNTDRLGLNAEPVQPSLVVSDNHLTEIIDLPSKGKFYSHPSLMSGKIEIFLMVARHEDILSNLSYFTSGVIGDKLLKSLIVDQTIDVKELLPVDIAGIIIAARSSAYGPSFKTKVECKNPKCKEPVQEVSISLEDDVKIIGGPSKKYGTEVVGNKIEITLPKSNRKVLCRVFEKNFEEQMLKILVDQHGLDKEEMIAKAAHGDLDIFIPNIDYLKIIVDSIDGSSENLEEKISNMGLFDIRFLKVAYGDTLLRYDMRKEVSCKCGWSDSVEVGIMTPDFFWPKI